MKKVVKSLTVHWDEETMEKVQAFKERHDLRSYGSAASTLVRIGAEVEEGASKNAVFAEMVLRHTRGTKAWLEGADQSRSAAGIRGVKAKAADRAREAKDAAEGPIEPDRANTGRRASKAPVPAPARKKAK